MTKGCSRAADALGVGDEFRACSVLTQAAANLLTPSGRYLMRFQPATVLAAELAGDTEIPTALARYDHLRRPRSQQVERMARLDPKISLSTSALTYGVMTRLTRAASRGFAERKTARLWDWTPPA